jgi:uncharacterized protein YsxB (DUF464 family)
VRGHIRTEQQLKLHIEGLQSKFEEQFTEQLTQERTRFEKRLAQKDVKIKLIQKEHSEQNASMQQQIQKMELAMQNLTSDYQRQIKHL